ncbi:MAG: bifunctional phosphopantothenoylcysteine decarboxylase/phosphopantothenate--cysteine ligase CoaBC, partial [Proteobacteria bacterium]|nr:bifunctional phosphopantothenoylcysteine decarboxylase/phosphopantothenate--cysteine ligase CoaBC [Pseudomonadota bacterium]
ATKANLTTLQDRGVDVVLPLSGGVACGDVGNGRLADSFQITSRILKAISPKDLTGKRILLTLGPTREPFDAVRFWSNPSTGLMGACLAISAWMRGADVTVIAGTTAVAFPDGIEVINVQTALEMHAAVIERWSEMDIGCATAAVADFAPVPFLEGKFKKDGVDDPVSFSFTRNPDILRDMGKSKKADQYLIGFAAETDDLEGNGRGKLERKNLDMIVANFVGRPGTGFASSTNEIMLLDREGRVETWPRLPKSEVAWRIWDHLLLI